MSITLPTTRLKRARFLWPIENSISPGAKGELIQDPKKHFRLQRLILHTIDYKDQNSNDDLLQHLRVTLQLEYEGSPGLYNVAFDNLPAFRFTDTEKPFDIDTVMMGGKAKLCFTNVHPTKIIQVVGFFEGVVAD